MSINSTTKPTVILAALLAGTTPSWSADNLDDLSLEDLTKTEITSVSRKSQSLANVPAAAFVISSEDIRRSGALTIPDVLRMAPGIEVAQIDNGRYAVSARGFNGRFANKLQVLIDGRSIYNPLFSGVMWENDPIALEDIERIEVIRGAGAAIWGVNAVNGVINIISKHTRSQNGGVIAPAIGTNGTGSLYARYGAAIDEDSSWKMSFQSRHAEPSRQTANGEEASDRLNNTTIDFRFDRNLGGGRDLSVWANAYRTSLGDMMKIDVKPTMPFQINTLVAKQNDTSQSISGRYRWLSSAGIESSVQMSIESASIEMASYIKQDRTTYDLDYQGRYTFAAHDLLWGLSHRTTAEEVTTSAIVLSIRNPEFTQRTTGVFIHDDWTLIPETLQFGAGARWDYTNLGGNTFAPSATVMWTPSRIDSVWLKYAKAPRMPARAEQDVSVMIGVVPAQPPNIPLPIIIRNIPGQELLKPESMQTFELGYRTQITNNFTISINAYRQRYSDIVSGELGSLDMISFSPLAIIQNVNAKNSASGWITGSELSADWLVLPTWRLQLSYAWTRIDMDEGGTPSANASSKDIEQQTPRHYGSLRSQWNISPHQQFDAWIRGSAGFKRTNAPFLDLAHVPGYVTLDLRYAHKLNKDLEIAVSGHNLIGGPRNEYISDYIPSIPLEVRPSLLISTRWAF